MLSSRSASRSLTTLRVYAISSSSALDVATKIDSRALLFVSHAGAECSGETYTPMLIDQSDILILAIQLLSSTSSQTGLDIAFQMPLEFA